MCLEMYSGNIGSRVSFRWWEKMNVQVSEDSDIE